MRLILTKRFILLSINQNYARKLRNKQKLNLDAIVLYNKIVTTGCIYTLIYSHILKVWDDYKINIWYFRTNIRNLQNTKESNIFIWSNNILLKNYYINTITMISYIFKSLRYWIIACLLVYIIIYHLVYIRSISYNKFIVEVVLLVMFTYWLLSGFVFFIKKAQYSKFTTALQRFWKRSFIIFWLLEAFIFLLFLYLTINASEEPVYMYDQIKIYKSHLFSWRWFIVKLLPYMFIFLLTSYTLLSFKWGLFLKQSNYLFIITLLLLYIVWLEFYQFFHIINWYGNIFWVYDYEEFLWNIEIELRRTRLTNNYVALCLMAKFWHLIFIFIFWIFFILRVNELGRLRLPFLSANLQNFLILYLMTWLYMYPWVKYIFRKYMDYSYYWFFTNFRELGLKIFIHDGLSLLSNVWYDSATTNISFFKNQGLFYYWNYFLSNTGVAVFSKHILHTLI